MGKRKTPSSAYDDQANPKVSKLMKANEKRRTPVKAEIESEEDDQILDGQGQGDEQGDTSDDENSNYTESTEYYDTQSDASLNSPVSEPLPEKVFDHTSVILSTKRGLAHLAEMLSTFQKETEKLEQSISERSKMTYKMSLKQEELSSKNKDYLFNLLECLQKREYFISEALRSRMKRKGSTGNEPMPFSPAEKEIPDEIPNVLFETMEGFNKLKKHNDNLEICTDPIIRFECIDKKDFKELTIRELTQIYKHLSELKCMVFNLCSSNNQ